MRSFFKGWQVRVRDVEVFIERTIVYGQPAFIEMDALCTPHKCLPGRTGVDKVCAVGGQGSLTLAL
eukprot:scaffold32897_cov36-Tisochrysis_lutea.AAC.1